MRRTTRTAFHQKSRSCQRRATLVPRILSHRWSRNRTRRKAWRQAALQNFCKGLRRVFTNRSRQPGRGQRIFLGRHRFSGF